MWRLLGGLVAVVAWAPLLACASEAAPSTQQGDADAAGLVNPFVGTGLAQADADAALGGDTFPGAVVPFGMLSWSPDTVSRPDGGGYAYSDSSILGFSLTHLSGPGGRNTGDVPILPVVGPIGMTPGATTQPFSHAAEQAAPGYYGVAVAPGAAATAIDTRLTATPRTGMAQFDFPPTTAANLLFKSGDSAMGDVLADVNVVGDREVEGTATSANDGYAPGSVALHFVAVFDRPFQSYGFWHGAAVTPSLPAPAPAVGVSAPSPCGIGGQDACTSGAWVTFDTTAQQRVQVKVGISYVSVDNARANLAAENPGWDFAAIRSRARELWDALLSRVEVAGGTHDQQVQLYTALYHSLLEPSVFSDVDGEYVGFDSAADAGVNDIVHRLSRGQEAQYTMFSGWDIYRSEFPLLALLVPRQAGDMVQSLLNDQAQGGWLPKWPYANKYTSIMTGDPPDAMIADAYVLGARKFDAQAALAAMVKGATQVTAGEQVPATGPWDPGGGQGWYMERPNLGEYEQRGYAANVSNDGMPYAGGLPLNVGASMTLEYASADFAISRFAADLGQADLARSFLVRSQDWTNIFNVGSCFIQPRDLTGSFPSRDPTTTGPVDDQYGQNGFQEGSDVQYTWMVPHDLHGLFTAMGGNAAAVARLDQFFTQLNTGPNRPYYWAGNEPDLEVPWEYDYAGAPSKTQEVVHRILSTVYSDSPGGLPGNDDLGSLSSWYVWAALGMYPETPGAPALALGAPLFPSVTLHLAGGDVSITAPGASSTAYVQGLRVDGRSWSSDWLPASVLTRGGETRSPARLDFSLGSTPSPSWGVAQEDEPPSYPAGPLQFPPGRTPPSGSACVATQTGALGGASSDSASPESAEAAAPAVASARAGLTAPPGPVVVPSPDVGAPPSRSAAARMATVTGGLPAGLLLTGIAATLAVRRRWGRPS